MNGCVIVVTDELGEHIEALCSIDNAAASAISCCAILGGSLCHHLVLALRLGIATSIFAGVGSHVEAFFVGLKDIDAGAVGLAIAFVHGAVGIGGDQVEARDATSGNLADIGGVLDAATNKLGLVDALVVDLVSSHHEDSLVVLDCDGVAIDLEH